jgi:hypothetical protein
MVKPKVLTFIVVQKEGNSSQMQDVTPYPLWQKKSFFVYNEKKSVFLCQFRKMSYLCTR